MTGEQIEALVAPYRTPKDYALGMKLARAMKKRFDTAILYGKDNDREKYFQVVGEVRKERLSC